MIAANGAQMHAKSMTCDGRSGVALLDLVKYFAGAVRKAGLNWK